MSKKQSLSELKAQRERVSTRKDKLNDDYNSLSEQIEELDASYIPARERFLKTGVAKLQEECGWTKGELINALGGTVSERHQVRKTSSSTRTYLHLIPLDKDATWPTSHQIKLTPKLSDHAKEIIARDGLIPLLEHTIKLTPDEDNKMRAIGRLNFEKNKGDVEQSVKDAKASIKKSKAKK